MALLWEIPGPFGSREQLEAAQALEGTAQEYCGFDSLYKLSLWGLERGACFVLRYLGQCRLDWQKLALELLVLILPGCWDCRPHTLSYTPTLPTPQQTFTKLCHLKLNLLALNLTGLHSRVSEATRHHQFKLGSI